MQSILTDAEVAALCHPLKQYAAQVRHLRRIGVAVLGRRPDGAPIVLRSSLEALKDRPQQKAGPAWGVHA